MTSTIRVPKEDPKFDFSKVGRSRRLARQNSEYLELESVIEKSQLGLNAEQARLTSKPAREAIQQLLRHMELISSLVHLPHLLFVFMESASYAAVIVAMTAAGHPLSSDQNREARNKGIKNAMQNFFAIDS